MKDKKHNMPKFRHIGIAATVYAISELRSWQAGNVLDSDDIEFLKAIADTLEENIR